MADRTIVSVSRKSLSAIEEPRFLIEHEGKLYLTAALLEYDDKHPRATDEQRAAIGKLRENMKQGRKVSAVHYASQVDDVIIAANTVGPGPGPSPGQGAGGGGKPH